MDELPTADTIADSVPPISSEEHGQVYEPLPADHIRLVQILPGCTYSTICCRLTSSLLDHKVEFTALSYTWGSGPNGKCIEINGVRFKIRKNLWRFLSHARDACMQGSFWIDALCINQVRHFEKASQVNLMPQIYRTATKVLVWLGPAYAGSDDAIHELRTSSIWSAKRLNAVWSRPGGIAMQHICARPFWKRLWIFQEILLAQAVEVMCGSQIVPFERLRTFLLEIDKCVLGSRLHENESYTSVRKSAALSIVMQTAIQSEKALWDLLRTTKPLRCTEIRDKVYALLGVASTGHEKINPDYDQPINILLNQVLGNLHKRQSPKSIQEVDAQCKELTGFLGVDPKSIFITTDRLSEDSKLPFGWRKNDISLSWTRCYGHVAIGKLLLNSGVISLRSATMEVASGNEASVQVLLDMGRNYFDWSILFYTALQSGRVRLVQLMLDSGLVQVNAAYREESSRLTYSALHIAIEKGDLGLAGVLLDAGADVVTRSHRHGNLLYLASEEGSLDVVRMLLAAGADVDDREVWYDDSAALYAAAKRGHHEVVDVLLHAGADVNARGGYHGSALQAASHAGHDGVVRRLLDAGAAVGTRHVGGRYSDSLHAALGQGHLGVVEMLLDAGADVSDRLGDQHGSLLYHASYWGFEQVVARLLEAGADVNVQMGGAHYELARECSEPPLNTLARLDESQYGLHAQVCWHDTALQVASDRGHRGVVKLLLDAGADVDAQAGGSCGNALFLASQNGHHGAVDLLIDAGADINAPGGLRGDTSALFGALRSGHMYVVELLLGAGAHVKANWPGGHGDALEVAYRLGDSELIETMRRKDT